MSLESLVFIARVERHKYKHHERTRRLIIDIYCKILDQCQGRDTWEIVAPKKYAHKVYYLLNFDHVISNYGNVWRITKKN